MRFGTIRLRDWCWRPGRISVFRSICIFTYFSFPPLSNVPFSWEGSCDTPPPPPHATVGCSAYSVDIATSADLQIHLFADLLSTNSFICREQNCHLSLLCPEGEVGGGNPPAMPKLCANVASLELRIPHSQPRRRCGSARAKNGRFLPPLYPDWSESEGRKPSPCSQPWRSHSFHAAENGWFSAPPKRVQIRFWRAWE